MNQRHRLHPIWMLLELIGLIKNSFFFFLFLFVIKYGSESTFILVGRIGFILFIIVWFVEIIAKWLTYRYEITDGVLHIYEGVFVKKHRDIALIRVQNNQTHTSFLLRLFRLTSLTLETATSGDDASVKFHVITNEESARIQSLVENAKEEVTVGDFKSEEIHEEHKERNVFFRASKRDIVKAAFTSFSFLVIFPIIGSIYSKIDDVYSLENTSKSIFSYFHTHSWVLILIIIIAMLLSVIFGFVKTYIKYGNFEISADEERIYIHKGVLSKSTFSITKDKVQAIQLQQSIMKRLLGMVEVKLLSAGSVGEEKFETNSLFPFLPVKQAYELVEKLLPAYRISDNMEKLPKEALWVRLIRPSYIWIIATACLLYFKIKWAFLSPLLLIAIMLIRVYDYRYSRYLINDRFVQIRSGFFVIETFITRRVKVQEIEVAHSWLQRKFGLASIQLSNRGKPLKVSLLKDVPKEIAGYFFSWYKKRADEVENQVNE